MTLRKCTSLAGVVFVALLAAATSGCSGGSATTSPPPAISVSLSSATGTVQEGTTAQFTAMVTNDEANKGVEWTVSCSVTACGSVSPSSTASGAPTTYTPPGSPASSLTVTVTAASAADTTKSASVTVNVPALTVSLTVTGVTVVAGNTAPFTATVTNDGANKGVTWTVSCSAAPCGSVSPAATVSGAATVYKAPTTAPAANLIVTLTATSVTDGTKTASATVTIPTITLSVTPSAGTVQGGGTAQFTATVANDAANKGVSWMVSCSAAPCGSVSPSATASGAATTYTAPSPALPGNLTVTLTATSVTNSAVTASATITIPGVGPAVSDTIPVGGAPNSVAVNSTTNKIYVTNFPGFCGSPGAAPLGYVSIIDGATDSTSFDYLPFETTGNPDNPTVVAGPISISVNPGASNALGAGEAYIFMFGLTCSFGFAGQSRVVALDLKTFAASSMIMEGPGTWSAGFANHNRIAVNAATGRIYLANSIGNNIVVIDPSAKSVVTLVDPNATGAIAAAVNPTTNKIYIANSGGNVTVVDGAANSVVATVSDPKAINPSSVAVDPTTNKIYVANAGSDNVTVIDGATNTVSATIAAGTSPVALDVDSKTNYVYVANSGDASSVGSVTVIDGTTNATVTLTDPKAAGPWAVAVNSETNKIYVANVGSSNVTVIDGAH
jgi:YVTN family beta-propeller protein